MFIIRLSLVLCFFLSVWGNIVQSDTVSGWQYQADLAKIWPQKTIERLENLLKQQLDDTVRANILIELSDLYRVTSQESKAKTCAEQAVELAHQISTEKPLILASALNAYGNVLMNNDAFRDYEKAFNNYQTALNLFSIEKQPRLYANILTNMAQLWVDVNKYSNDHKQKEVLYQNDEKIVLEKAIKALDMALAATRNLPDNDDKKAANLIHLSQIARHIQTELVPHDIQLTLKAYQALEEVRHFDATKFPRMVSYAYGYLGELYQVEHRYQEALRLTRQAIFHAQKVQATDLLYLWERQLGQLLTVQEERKAAISAYQRAVTYLNDIRPHLAAASYRSRQTSFRETVAGKVYLELIDLLLQKYKSTQSQACLSKIQTLLEQFKAVELENYFKDDCVGIEKQNDSSTATKRIIQKCVANFQSIPVQLSEKTAVLYPIIFHERLELLLHTSQQKRVQTVPVTKQNLENKINKRLIAKLNRPNAKNLLPSARQLYDWLIRPVESDMAQVETLVIIPDGRLRAIPFAVLHDGNRYLIEIYALAVTPALALTERNPWQRKQGQNFLLNGLSKKVEMENYKPLIYVEREIEAINNLYPSDILLDNKFTSEMFNASLENMPYQVVHIATHGKFERKAKNSFLLTYNGLLKMDDLEKAAQWGTFRVQPVDLLTLSACQSAMGDDDAVLGLSGIAVKAGARSAVASLWQVNDLSTCYLMEAFYHHLTQPNISKAKALQKAQIQLLRGEINQESTCGKSFNTENYKHPNYWAAFLLIGNWL